MFKTERCIYSGIGSRETPDFYLLVMERLATIFEKLGYAMRSGGARGADKAFEKGVKEEKNQHIYNPFIDLGKFINYPFIPDIALEIAKSVMSPTHWRNCNTAVRALHARNALILLGGTLDRPSDFVVCWTPGGEIVGGTGIALRIAQKYQIPVYNLYNKSEFKAVIRKIKWKVSLL